MAEQSIPSTTELGAAGIADAPTHDQVDRYFQISARGSTQKREVVAGITTFMAMVYAVLSCPACSARQALTPAPCSLRCA